MSINSKRNKDLNYIMGKKYDSMMSRCYREKDASYKYYSEQGIKVCSEWIKDINSFKLWFLTELSRLNRTPEDVVKYPKEFTLDRINSKNHYTPDNCRLANFQMQSRNKINRKKKNIISAEGEQILI